jgi:hypothetical protein
MGAESKVWNQDADHVVATCGSLVVALWRGQGTYKNWRIESTPVFRYLQTTSPKGCLVLVVAEEKAVGPDAQARMEVDMLARERVKQVKGSAILAYGPAMRLASIRALATAINIFGKTGLRVFTDPSTAMAALAESARKAEVGFDIPAATQLVSSIRTVK